MSSEADKSQETLPPVPEEAPKKKSKAKWILPVILIAAGVYGFKHMAWSRAHEATDNAQVAGDVVLVVPQVSGIIKTIEIKDNQEVQKGDLLVTIDPEKYEAAVQQAEANLASAIADAQAAGIDVQLTRANSAATDTQSNGIVAQADAGLGAAQTSIAAANAQLTSSQSQETSASMDIQTARSQASNADEGLKQAKAAVSSAQAMLTSALSNIKASESAIRSAQAKADLAKKDEQRAKGLFDIGAISHQQLDNASVNATAAQANLESVQEQLNAAKATVDQRRAELQSAQARQRSAELDISQAKVSINIAQQKLATAHAGSQLSRTQIDAARQSLALAKGKQTQSQGERQATNTGSIQVKLKEAAQQQALAKVELARAALKNAKLDLEHTKVYAPCAGLVTKRTTEEGNLAQAGASLFSLVRSDSIYVMANFKETQVAKLKPGEEVDVEIDAFPGENFHAVIDSQSAATGSTFALLPPDNATGNFVKVVQRLPVKIKFTDPQEKLKNIQIGMSAMVTVKVG